MISVVIPTLNEAGGLESLLPRLASEDESFQIIVVDGGSADESADIADRLGAQVLSAPRGRGSQLHAGAQAARGAVLFFLHADTIFPLGGLSAIRRALESHPQAVGGNFRLLFDGDQTFDRWLEGFYAWIRSKGLYYGDSGIFRCRGGRTRVGSRAAWNRISMPRTCRRAAYAQA